MLTLILYIVTSVFQGDDLCARKEMVHSSSKLLKNNLLSEISPLEAMSVVHFGCREEYIVSSVSIDIMRRNYEIQKLRYKCDNRKTLGDGNN